VVSQALSVFGKKRFGSGGMGVSISQKKPYGLGKGEKNHGGSKKEGGEKSKNDDIIPVQSLAWAR